MPRPTASPSSPLARAGAVVACLAVLCGVLLVPAAPASAATEAEGYLELPDGTELRYTLLLPDGEGPFPTVLQYSGYNPGNNAYDGTLGKMVDQLVAEDLAFIGVNLRGSGCSGGTFSPFTEQWAKDGVDVIEWIAEQEWSDGNVAMGGVSYPAITSLVTSVEQPDHLRAILASVPVVDLYRDVAYPGGAFNQTFAGVWTAIQKYGTFFGIQETAEGDTQCPTGWPGQNDPTDLTGVQAASNPYIDSMDRYRDFLMPEDLADIEVPALVQTAWQDEQLGSRAMHAYEHMDLDRTWIVGGNGDHIGMAGSEWYRELGVAFLSHFLRGGAPEDFDRPHVQVTRDVRRGDATFGELDTYETYPVPTVTTELFGQADGTFALQPPAAAGELGYRYPQPAPSVPVGIDIGVGVNPEAYDEAYDAPIPPGGSVSFTTPPLAEDLQVHGPGSLDLWLSTTADDLDLQVTLTEVRPDGQETYVQRGWLRASHRKLDPERTTPTRPVPTHLEADATPLTPGEVTPMRVELWPVDHVLRAGSALRLYVEAPVGFTGFRQLDYVDTPQEVTLHVGPDTPTVFRFGRIAEPQVTTGLPECGTLLNMPCRPSPEAPPEGEMSLAAAGTSDVSAASDTASATGTDGVEGALAATGGGPGVLLGVAGVLAVLLRRRR